jgi:hypothetical protein
MTEYETYLIMPPHDMPQLIETAKINDPQLQQLYQIQDLPDDFIIYGIDNKNNSILVGPRFYLNVPNCPLFQIDLHLNIARCKRCKKIEQFKPEQTIETDAKWLIYDTYLNLETLHTTNHMNCKPPICLN